MKICDICNTSSFDNRGRCRKCSAIKAKIWRENNKEKSSLAQKTYREKNKIKRNEYSETYRLENRDKCNELSCLWRENNREKSRSSVKRWVIKNKEKYINNLGLYRINNKEKIAETTKAWRLKNPDIWRIYAHNRRFWKINNGGVLSKNIVSFLYKKQNGKCACCGELLNNDFHLDHILPLALGGKNSDDNVQLLTPICNLQKGAKHPLDFMQWKQSQLKKAIG